MPKKSKIITQDSFKNVNKNLGTERDPRQTTSFHRNKKIDYQTANNFYSTNWLATNVVDVPIEESVKNWREVFIEDEKKLIDFVDFEKKLKVKSIFSQSNKWAKVFGGSIVVMIFDNKFDDMSEPLNIENIAKGSLKRLVPLDRWEVYANNINLDPISDNFLKPDFYTYAQTGLKVHHSRVLRFNGESPTIQEMKRDNGWSLSVYERLMPVIQDAMTSSDLLSGLLYQSNVDIYKIDGLNEAVEQDKTEQAVNRIKLANDMKSTINGVALDKEDDFMRITSSFAGLAEIDNQFLQKVAGAYGIPITKLLGTSASGLNATGEGDLKNYYDKVSAIQERDYYDNLVTLDKVMSRSLFGTDEKITFEFRPLFQMSEKEQADVELTRASRDQIYLINGVVDSDTVLKELNHNNTYGNLDEVLELIEDSSDIIDD
jgi:phage-related protein (TIGR01555 family)